MPDMPGFLVRGFVVAIAIIAVLVTAAFADDRPAAHIIQEEVWAIPVTLPTIAYVVRPVGKGPFPLVVMNHGVSLNQKERGFFPLVEFRDAAMWFAKRGYMVVAPTDSGYGAAAFDVPEQGHYSLFFSKVGNCDNPNFHDAGRLVALMDKWIIEYMADQKLIVPDNVIVVGQSAGGWAAIALSSENVPGIRAIIAFAAGRGGRVGGRPNNNCAPERLVAATGEFGRTARTPHAVDLHRKRYLLRSGIIQANARGLYRGWGKCRVSPAPSIRQRGTFPDRLAWRPSVVGPAGWGIPGQTQINGRRKNDGGER